MSSKRLFATARRSGELKNAATNLHDGLCAVGVRAGDTSGRPFNGRSRRTRTTDRLEQVLLLSVSVLPAQFPAAAGEQRQPVLPLRARSTHPGLQQELVQFLPHRTTVLPRSPLHSGCLLAAIRNPRERWTRMST